MQAIHRDVVDDNGMDVHPSPPSTISIETHRCKVSATDTQPYVCDQRYPGIKGIAKIFNCSSAKCKVCLDLNVDYFPASSCYLDSDSSILIPLEEECRRILTKLHILESSKDSCRSCEVLYLAVVRSIEWNTASLPGPPTAKDCSDYFVAILLRPGFAVELLVSPPVGEGEEVSSMAELFIEDADHPSPWKSIGPATHRGHMPPTYPECVDFIKKHLTLCESSHTACQQTDLPDLPRRVLDVRNLLKPRLFCSINQHARYFTLSHSWGDKEHKPLMTVKSNLHEHRREIPWDSLSELFKSAIIIARFAGASFLWIDSLCIVQDDPLDWETQAAKMAEIYKNSELTLAVIAAKDGRGSCIMPRPRKPEEERPFTQGELGKENIILREPCWVSHEAMYISPRSTRALKEYGRTGHYELAPLMTRAWVFQESVMSRRTIYFHGDELMWECRQCLDCECGYLKWSRTRITDICRDDPSRIPFLPIPGWKPAFVALMEESTKDSLTEQWYNLVLAYSALDITYETDRLPALSGLASSFSQRLNCAYLAGLWEHDLWRGLLWQRPEAFGRKANCRRLEGKASSIPTWSWASIIRVGELDAPIFDFASLTNADLEKDERFAVISAKCTPSTTNVFGHVSGGMLQLRGALVETWLSEHGPAHWWSSWKLILVKDDQLQLDEYYAAARGDMPPNLVFDVGNAGFFYRDPNDKFRQGQALFCLCVAKRPMKNNFSLKNLMIHECLVLKKIQEKTYQRVGYLEYLPMGTYQDLLRTSYFHINMPFTNWFEDAAVEEVYLV
ncbi:hypothetical protein HYFRA_00008722 [Hymenoscyphus fraxineus]|uniref:Heterokaryon incompatibility domain-containing protein n=1 Tax=Hymenoscyphus fraxineus TaxID=746836 RepID=A0A9N9L2K0_9HELO|nr:hypothetical protein HYFRA_00008722 [Hymenoscyphus fraxineus]